MWLCTLLIFPNRYRGFPPPPAFIVPGCLHDQHSDPVGNDTLVQESITSPQSLPMWTFVSWAILNVFRCFFFFFFGYLVWVILTCWDRPLESRPYFHFFPSCSSSWLFLVGPGSFSALQALWRCSALKQWCDSCSYTKCPQGGSTSHV